MRTLSGIATRLALAALLLARAPFAGAAEDILPPGEAFGYAVTDTGSALEIDWAVVDGYYLYRSKLGFRSRTPSVVFGDAELPQGLRHEDEYFGVQEVYRGRFYVTVPYTVSGERPEHLEFDLLLQGCADAGLCYPPQIGRAHV